MTQETARTTLPQTAAELELLIHLRTQDLMDLNQQFQAEITERRRVEAELRRALQFQEKVLELTTDAIAVLDLNGQLSQLNHRALELTGYSRADLEGRSFTVLVPPEHLPNTAAQVRRVLEEGIAVQGIETEIVRPDGTRRAITFNVAPMVESDRVIGAVGTAVDTTDWLRAQTALEKYACEMERSNRELSQFASVASHDLQEPLRVVAGYLQLLDSQHAAQLPPEGRRYIQRASASVQRMNSLINDLLAYARVGSRGVRRAQVDVSLVVQRVWEDLAISLQESGAQLHQGPLPILWADASQLVQLFQNLLGNAVKFRGQSPPHISLTAQRDERAWRFSVEDNGIGIPPEHAERVFHIFQRLHTRHEIPGNGIGLAICKKIVEGHGGRIWVTAAPHGGARFVFTIPDGPEGQT